MPETGDFAMLMLIGLLAATGAGPTASNVPLPDTNDPMICRRPASETGTHMRPQQVCLHKSQWDYLERKAQNDIRVPESRLKEQNRSGGREGSPL